MDKDSPQLPLSGTKMANGNWGTERLNIYCEINIAQKIVCDQYLEYTNILDKD